MLFSIPDTELLLYHRVGARLCSDDVIELDTVSRRFMQDLESCQELAERIHERMGDFGTLRHSFGPRHCRNNICCFVH